jgi:dTDP-4-dehydrorhamnose reductase
MKILVTGSNGQLGSELHELSPNHPEWEFLFTDVDTLDITNEHAVEVYLKNNRPAFIVNCAAYTAVDKAETDTNAAHQLNAIAPGILAKLSKKYSSGFIHISTDYVFDGLTYKPYSEIDAVNPAGVYGKTKLAGERLIRSANPNAIIIRTAWLYSAYGSNFVKTMFRLGKERDVLNVVYDQVGTPTYAADLAKAVIAIAGSFITKPADAVPGIYHFSNEGVASWYDFAKSIFEIAGIECQVMPVLSKEYPTPAKRPHYSVLNKSKIKATFNINMHYWKDSLKVCINKIQKQNYNGK